LCGLGILLHFLNHIISISETTNCTFVHPKRHQFATNSCHGHSELCYGLLSAQKYMNRNHARRWSTSSTTQSA